MSEPRWWEDPSFWLEAVRRSGGRVGEPRRVKTFMGEYDVIVDHDLSPSPIREARSMPFDPPEFQLRVSSSCALCGSPVGGHSRCQGCGGSEWKGARVRAVSVPRSESGKETIRIVVDEGAGEPGGTGCLGALVYLGVMFLACWGIFYAVKNF